MYKLVIILFFLFISCSKNQFEIEKVSSSTQDIYFDVVEKKLLVSGEYPKYFTDELEYFFINRIKSNGIDGILQIEILEFTEEITDIENGKKINLSLLIDFLISKENTGYSKKSKINVNEFGSLSGNFSLNEFDEIKKNTVKALFNRLSEELNINN